MQDDSGITYGRSKPAMTEENAFRQFGGKNLLKYEKVSAKKWPEAFRSVLWQSIIRPRRNTSLLWRPKYYFDSFFMKTHFLVMLINLIKVFYW